MKKTIAAVVMSAVAAVGSANAAIVFGNLGATGSGDLSTDYRGLSTTGWAAVGFTTDATFTQLQTATIGLEGSGSVQLSVYTSVSGGSPSPTPSFTSLVSDTQSYNTAEDVPEKITFNLNTFLSPNTTYWFVASRASGTADWAASLPAANAAALNGSSWTFVNGLVSSNSGGAWSDSSSVADNLSLSVTAIPEPGTWAAMAILAGGAAFAGWRRRQQQLA